MPMKVQWISLLTYSSLHPTCFKMFFARHSDFPFSFKTISFKFQEQFNRECTGTLK